MCFSVTCSLESPKETSIPSAILDDSLPGPSACRPRPAPAAVGTIPRQLHPRHPLGRQHLAPTYRDSLPTARGFHFSPFSMLRQNKQLALRSQKLPSSHVTLPLCSLLSKIQLAGGFPQYLGPESEDSAGPEAHPASSCWASDPSPHCSPVSRQAPTTHPALCFLIPSVFPPHRVWFSCSWCSAALYPGLGPFLTTRGQFKHSLPREACQDHPTQTIPLVPAYIVLRTPNNAVFASCLQPAHPHHLEYMFPQSRDVCEALPSPLHLKQCLAT